jgi:O-methyltransferase involved in polyketide biosynthesis
VFDRAVSDFIAAHDECTVVHLGVGMDSRVFRRVVEHFPSGEVFFDGYSEFGVRTQKQTNAIVRRAKATLRWGMDDPRELEEAGLTLVSYRTAAAFVPEEDWARLPLVQRQLYRVALWIPVIRKMGKLPRYRFGS